MRNQSPASAACACALLLVTPLLAHDGDGKVLDRMGRYEGPGYRAAQRDVPPYFPASGVSLRSWVSLAELDSWFGATVNSGNSGWGYTSPSGREYAILGTSRGTAFVEVTDPGAAQVVAVVPGPVSLWRDIRTYQNFAYAVSEGGGGIQVISLANIDAGQVTHVRSVLSGGSTSTHTVCVNEASGYLYRSGGSGNGLRIYNLNPDPANPQYVASWSDRYSHEVSVFSYTSGPYAGREIAFVCGGYNGGGTQTGLDILDVTNKQNIFGVRPQRVFWPNAGYSHQIWLSPDKRYGYVNDEFDEMNFGLPTTTIIIDLQSLENAATIGSFTNGNPAVGHNLYTRDHLIFEANYRSGLRIFDATNPTAPVEVAYFDTWPSDDAPRFNGLWNVYPYFPSGTVIGTDLERGLFVWRLDIPPIRFDYPSGRPALLSPSGDTLLVRIVEQGGALDVASPVLRFEVDGAASLVPLVDLGDGLFEARFPATPCGRTVAWSLAARTTTGVTVTDPAGQPTAAWEAVSAAAQSVVHSDMMETDAGWTVGSPDDNATTGIWVRVDPVGTLAQPEDDHTPDGTMCWVTGQGVPGGALGDNDVDGGQTTLTSPTYSLAGLYRPRIGYWRWFSNTTGGVGGAYQDPMIVSISNDNGQSWVTVETVGPGGPQTSGGWIYHEFAVESFVQPTAQVKLRFVASDFDPGAIVEAAIDDLSIYETDCGPCPFDLDGDRSVGLADLAVLLADFGQTGPLAGDVDGDGDVDLSDLTLFLAHYGTVCP